MIRLVEGCFVFVRCYCRGAKQSETFAKAIKRGTNRPLTSLDQHHVAVPVAILQYPVSFKSCLFIQLALEAEVLDYVVVGVIKCIC